MNTQKIFEKDDLTFKVDITLKDDNTDKPIFSVSANIYKRNKNICGGQCLYEIHELMDDNEEFNIIYDMWKKYHLNDVHPECEHQRALGWLEIAKEPLTIYSYFMNNDTSKKQDELRKRIVDDAINRTPINLTDADIELLQLKGYFSTSTQCDDSRYYLHSQKQSTKGWEHKEFGGILSKPCPVCGYKYGTSWNYMPINANDLKIIKGLFGNERN